MKEQSRTNRWFGRAAAVATMIGLVAAVSAGPAQATPARASAAVGDDARGDRGGDDCSFGYRGRTRPHRASDDRSLRNRGADDAQETVSA